MLLEKLVLNLNKTTIIKGENKMKKNILFIVLFCLSSLAVFAEVSNLYFMNYLPYRTYMNPALRPICGTYVELPGISTISIEVGNNSIGINDFIQYKDGKMVTSLHPDYGDRDALYKSIKNNTIIHQELSVSILGFGFRVKERGYFSFNLSAREDLTGILPKDLFKLALYGTPDTVGVNRYNLSSTSADASVYIDMSGAYSHRINEQWTVGGRLHLLMGLVNARASFSSFNLDASIDQWNLNGNGSIRASIPGITVELDEEGHISKINYPTEIKEYLQSYRPSLGAAIDLGGEYKPLPELSISLSLKDVGFMFWQNAHNAGGDIDYTFTGVEYKPEEQVNYGDSLLKALQESYVYDVQAGSYVSAMNAKMYVGVEYSFLKDMMSVGLLSRTDLNACRFSEELTLAYNLRPCGWFGLSASYSFISGGFSTLGLGFNFRLPPFSIYFAGDYMPLYYSKEGIPYRSERLNLQAGIVLTFGCKKCKTKPLYTPTDFAQ